MTDTNRTAPHHDSGPLTPRRYAPTCRRALLSLSFLLISSAAHAGGIRQLEGPANTPAPPSGIRVIGQQHDAASTSVLRLAAPAVSAPAPAASYASASPALMFRRCVAGSNRRLHVNAYVLEIAQAANAYGVPEALIRAVIHAESAFRPAAVSHANAQGLMQLIPATAARFGVADPWDPAQNIRGGAEYLSWLLRHFDGDLVKALAGYNAGEGAVRRHGGVPPYRETQAYVVRVQQLYAAYQQALAGGITLVNLPVTPYGSPGTC